MTRPLVVSLLAFLFRLSPPLDKVPVGQNAVQSPGSPDLVTSEGSVENTGKQHSTVGVFLSESNFGILSASLSGDTDSFLKQILSDTFSTIVEVGGPRADNTFASSEGKRSSASVTGCRAWFKAQNKSSNNILIETGSQQSVLLSIVSSQPVPAQSFSQRDITVGQVANAHEVAHDDTTRDRHANSGITSNTAEMVDRSKGSRQAGETDGVENEVQ
ncbi:hypothetical protein HG530_014451 [Fusarium avenaceum]|nr:hypothetical protein HG530_014451 [Fusarium avenaceum]